jgi:thiol-activated cytolysin
MPAGLQDPSTYLHGADFLVVLSMIIKSFVMNRIKIIVILGFFFLLACEKNKIDPQEFNELVKALSYLDQPEEIPVPIEIEVVDSSEASGDYVCSVKRYKAAPGYDEMFLMDPTTDVIYPGAIIKGESIPTGEYIPIVADRKPMTISVSLQNIAGSPSRTVEEPKLSSVRDALNDILSADVTGATPAKISFEIENVYSEEQLSLAVQGNYKNSFVDVSASFDFSRQDIRSRLVVKFLQVYYTVDMDLPQNPDDLFEELPSMESLGSTSPLYVSTVSYGRMVLFTVESTYSSTEINTALNAAFSSGVQSGSIDVDAHYQKIIDNSTMKAFILGGSGGSAVQSVNGIEGIVNFITSGGDYSKDSPGAALSYKLRFLKDNSVANIILASEYNVRQCQRIFSNYEVELWHIKCDCNDAGVDAELFGWLGFRIPDEDPVWLWIYNEGNPQTIGEYGILDIYKSAKITLEHANAESFIILDGTLFEEDIGGDDHLGASLKNVYLADFNGSLIELHFNGDDNVAKAIFTITPLDK